MASAEQILRALELAREKKRIDLEKGQQRVTAQEQELERLRQEATTLDRMDAQSFTTLTAKPEGVSAQLLAAHSFITGATRQQRLANCKIAEHRRTELQREQQAVEGLKQAWVGQNRKLEAMSTQVKQKEWQAEARQERKATESFSPGRSRSI